MTAQPTRRNKHINRKIWCGLILLLLCGCSTTSSVPEGDQLYVGLKKIAYDKADRGQHLSDTQTEIEAALATKPNGALLGSSYIRSPFPVRLWIYNAASRDSSKLSQWVATHFGTKPVLMSWVNPELRASVAKSVLQNHGYLTGDVDFKTLTMNNPKKAKIAYTVHPRHLYTLDSISYTGFDVAADSLLRSSMANTYLLSGDPFDASTLEQERARIATLFRDNGYFYYQQSYASYLADTVNTPGKVQLKLQLTNRDERALRRWYIGNIDIELRRSYMDTLANVWGKHSIKTHYNGKHLPLRPGIIMQALKLRPRALYSYDNYQESADNLTQTGIFSLVDFNFTPRDTTSTCDTLDVRLNCVLDKPYEFYIETNAIGKTTGRVGPELVIGLSKLNAFRGGEKLDLNLHGSYEWQTHGAGGSGSSLNSYEYGGDVSLEMPRLFPMTDILHRIRRKMPRHRAFFPTASTTLKFGWNTINRADYFKRHIVSAELSYSLQTSPSSLHEFSPLTLEYEYMSSVTDSFSVIMSRNPYLQVSMQDQFIPKMSYTYTYSSPSGSLHPLSMSFSVSESANLLSLGYMAFGKSWNEKDKKLAGNPYAQFVKLTAELTRQWSLAEHTSLVGHVAGGVIWCYGNSNRAPYSEQFYMGGANSVRAFTVRTLGPGAYHTDDARSSYLDQTGDLKLLANLELRTRLLGSLYGALFVDAGNVWLMHDDGRDDVTVKLKDLPSQMAVGTGVGLRYDLGFFVLRLDWGLGLHLPYDTTKKGWFNIPSFSDAHSLHFAVGYPF